jgi:hypothetical protein
MTDAFLPCDNVGIDAVSQIQILMFDSGKKLEISFMVSGILVYFFTAIDFSQYDKLHFTYW